MSHMNGSQSSPANRAANNDGSDMEWSDEEGTVVDGIYIPPPIKHVETNEKRSRLIITKITNGFFKSFADEQTLGPFHIRFNAIIGPNGSGKSNVIDSLLFVFGYRASKIRSKKLSVLIHNSENHRNVQTCTVTIYFCEIVDDETDPEKYEIVPGSEFAVSRTANKDNSSYYELNGRRVHFREIAKILRHHGIDLIHNRFLILQGEVEEIAMMKCKGATENETGMLEYLEDVIGTDRYKKPLAALAERVEFLSEKATEKINRLKLVAKELEQLRTPMEEAITFVKAENQIIQCKNILYQKEIVNLEHQSKNLENEREKMAEDEAKFLERLNELNAQKQEKTNLLKEQAKNFEHLQQRRDQMRTNLKNAEKKDAQIQADIVHVNNNRKKCKAQLENEKKNLAKLEKVPEENEKMIAEQEADEKQLIKRREKLEEDKAKVLSNIREQTEDLQKEKGKLEQELAKFKEKSDASQAEYLMVESKLKICQSNEENERKKLDEFQQIYEKTKQDIQEKTAESSQLRKKIPLTEKSLKNALERLRINKKEESQLSSELTEKRYQIEQIKSNMQASRSRGKVLDSLMQQKRDGNCDGLYGRLGDLGAIDQTYDVAISTACGRLDNIVVDTVATAQWCIEFLKKYDIGRANFIPLDKQEHLRDRANSKINTPENVHRLYDLIKVQNDELKTAFYFALGDTLVANDLEQASRIAYGERRFRVVTLKGDLIETSGTMSGGGKTVMRGKMGQSIQDSDATPGRIEKMESQLNKSEERLRTLRQEQNSLESQVRTLEDELRRMKLEFEKLTKDLPFLEEQLPLLNQQYKKQEQIVKTTKTDPAVVRKLTHELEAKKSIAEKNAEVVKKLQDRVDILSNEINEKTSGKIKTLDKHLNEVIKAIDKCKNETTRLKIAIRTNTKNLTNCKSKIEKLENEIHNAEENLKRMKNERDALEEDATKMIEIIDEIEPQLEEAEKIYAEINQEVDKFTKQENKLKSEKVDIDQNRKALEKKLNTCKEAVHQWHVKLNQLKLQKLPKDQLETLPKLSEEELANKNMEVVELEMKAAQNSIASSKPNLNAINEFYECEKIYLRRYDEMNEINQKRNEMKALYERVRNQRKEEFMIGFNQIRTKLQEMYQMITIGGNADFEIVDSFDPFTEGIQFNVRPPKKTWKKISNLSGGEKTLSSLALVFAMHYYKPCPLYVMDEIDAALDFKNVSIIGHYIKERTKNAQFIIISLRTNMFELADYLIGIYKTYNSTKTVTIDPRKIENNDNDEEDNEQISED